MELMATLEGGMEMDSTAARYLGYMVHGFYNGLVVLQEDPQRISDEEMETIYTLGYNFFTYGKYKAARDIFTGLTIMAPSTAHYWRALGAVNQQLKDYREAIAAYDIAIANDGRDIVSYVYRGECRILSRNVETGLRDLEQVVRIGAADPQCQAWVERSNLLLRVHRQS
jgi:type III secretion system low calcium response chaperone LcrH/SycD